MYEDAFDELEFDEFDDFDGFDEFDALAEGDDYDQMDFAADDFDEMEDLMEGALMAESQEEEDEFLGALLSVASRALPVLRSVGRRALPLLGRVARHVVRRVRNSPQVRRAARAGVNVLTRTAADVARRYARGRPVNARYVARRAAGYSARVLPYAVYGRRGYPAWSRRRRPLPAYRRPPRRYVRRRRLCPC